MHNEKNEKSFVRPTRLNEVAATDKIYVRIGHQLAGEAEPVTSTVVLVHKRASFKTSIRH